MARYRMTRSWLCTAQARQPRTSAARQLCSWHGTANLSADPSASNRSSAPPLQTSPVNRHSKVMGWSTSCARSRRCDRIMLTFAFLDAHHGDACLMTWRGGGQRRTMLIDGGPAAAYWRAIMPQLSATATSRLDIVCVTHIDDDHIAGV